MRVIETAARYTLRKREESTSKMSQPSLVEIIQDMLDRNDISQATKLTTRSALLWYIRSYGNSHQPEDFAKAEGILNNMDRRKGRKSTNRPKKIPESDLTLIMRELHVRKHRSFWARRCAIWLHAGLYSGARPIEWLHAQWADPEHTALRIYNAKVKLQPPAFLAQKGASVPQHDREIKSAHQNLHNEQKTFRDIPVESDVHRAMIKEHLILIAEWAPNELSDFEREKRFRSYYNQCRKVLDRVCRKLWGEKKLYSMYTMRKQFSANMKAALGSVATSALMGHSREDSPSAAAYGKANQAHSAYRKSPSSEVDNQHRTLRNKSMPRDM